MSILHCRFCRNIGLLSLIFSCPTSALELATKYQWAGVNYPSLYEAERALRNDAFIGSSFYSYQYTWKNGALRNYGRPPTDNFFEEPRQMFWSLPGIACDNCPILDQFGNDICNGAPSGQGCDSEENWLRAMQDTWPGIDCQPVRSGETPWALEYRASTGMHQLPGEYLRLFSRYSRSVEATFPDGSHSLCGKSWDFTLYGLAPGHCPAGYQNFSYGGDTAQCHNSVIANIAVSGAPSAEPTTHCAIGNPCHPANGDKTLSQMDFISDSLPFSRHYHSIQSYPESAGLGKGWSHTYSSRGFIEEGIIKIIDGQGNLEQFRCVDQPACTTYVSVSKPGHILRVSPGKWQVYLKTGEVRRYDSNGRLVSISDRRETYRFITISYNTRGLVDLVFDQFGRSLKFNYNPAGLLESVFLPDGESILYEYRAEGSSGDSNSSWNLIKVIYQDLTERIYHYEDADEQGQPRHPHLLTGITDENGVRYATYTYDNHARVTSSEHAGGAGRITLDYTRRPGESSEWSISRVTRPLGEVITYGMEPGAFRNITGIEDSSGGVVMSYDPVTSWRTSVTDREGKQTTFTYGPLHEISRTEAAGTPEARVIESEWDESVNRIRKVTEQGVTTSYSYNSRGQLLSRSIKDTSSSATSTWAYRYFEPPAVAPLIGQLEFIDGPRTDVDDVTVFEYYVSNHPDGDYLVGDLKSVVNALGHRTEYLKYDFNGRPLQVRDANGLQTRFAYHPRGWLSSRSIDGRTTWFSYDNAGNLTRVTQPDGSHTHYQYDEAHRLTMVSDTLGNRIEYVLDSAGNRVSEKTHDASGVLRRQLGRVYDSLGRLVTLLDGNGDATGHDYDGNGNRVRTLDANLNGTDYEYDGLGRLSRIIDSILGESRVEYDSRDNVVKVTDPSGNETWYSHDELDKLQQVDSPDTGNTRFEHDAAGNRTAKVDARNTRVEYVYDALNRLTEISYPDGTLDTIFSYDEGEYGKGRLTRMSDSAGTVEYVYDRRGNLLSETRSIDDEKYVTSYVYDENDRVNRITYPSGMGVEYRLDSTGRIDAVNQITSTLTSPLASEIRYEPFGPIKSFVYGNGLIYRATYDRDYELDRLQSGSGLDWSVHHDPAGNILFIDDVYEELDQAFDYDDLNRLTEASGGYPTVGFEYDANGNRLSVIKGVDSESYDYETQSNRLARQGDWSIERDPAGNRVAKLEPNGHGQLYSYAGNGRLSATLTRGSNGDNLLGSYSYDGKGQRVTKAAGGRKLHFVYGLSGELLGEYVPGADEFTEYVYLHGQPIALYRQEIELEYPPVAELVLDAGDPGTSSTGRWKVKSHWQDFGDDYLFAGKAKGRTYRWTATPPGKQYDVYAWWRSRDNYAAEVKYTIRYGTGQSGVVTRSHKTGGGQWQYLGSYTREDRLDYVEVSSPNNRFVADAIKWVASAEPVRSISQGTYFIHPDHLGTPRSVSDKIQAIVWRWDSSPFGDSLPNEDPDGDFSDFTLNLRFPGQYFDEESGLHYNYFRTFDPETGRYIESDPIGLEGGLNTYVYAGQNPLRFVDPLGLVVFGEWIKSPKFNISNYKITGIEFTSPQLSKWGYLQLLRIHGNAAGFVNIDVRCSDPDSCEMDEWEIHEKMGVSFSGYKDIGPNIAAAGVGTTAGPLAGFATGIFTFGGSSLTALLGILKEVESVGSNKIRWLYELGPTAICQGTR